MSKYCFAILVVSLILFLVLLALILVLTSSSEFFTTEDPMIPELHAILSKIHPVANQVNIRKGDKSFTTNKTDITLCLKDQDGEYYNKNMLVYVAVHELAHTICKSVGHTNEFYTINDKLLNKAEKLGYYNPSIPIVKDYIQQCR